MINQPILRNMICLCLFAFLLIFTQTDNYILLAILGISAIVLFYLSDKQVRFFIITIASFGIGFFLYLQAISTSTLDAQSKELTIFLKRLSLLFIILPLVLVSFFNKLPFIQYWKKPKWNEMVSFPLMWSGFHQTKIKHFLLIAITINILSFAPFMVVKGWGYFQEVWLIALIFPFTNAILEELIWRGVLLSRFSEQFGDKWAVVITSLGFGLQHYSLGFSWGLCIAFATGGFFYGALTIKSGSIFPTIIWHIALNILMVFGGMIV
ncbi:CPBP family intramembrane glutamic endopeptidase [Risungbinella massiliensis]|uniref:CPBP family intramembrane glutamic endopeptidase n=1 Tax=Risungbinella massiliensis TaxID=1329796 RepID=UPI001E4202CA|nr:type II CAAX endopeptidase family protein [Risungbinella massiliensis]